MAAAIAALGGCQLGAGAGRPLHQATTTPELPGTTPGVPSPNPPPATGGAGSTSTTDVGTLWTADGGTFAGSGTTVPYGTTAPPYETGGFGLYSDGGFTSGYAWGGADGGSFFPSTGAGAGLGGSGTMGQPFGLDAGMP